jgi:hypothetical protein
VLIFWYVERGFQSQPFGKMEVATVPWSSGLEDMVNIEKYEYYGMGIVDGRFADKK